MSFLIGDRVRVIGNRYPVTVAGSEGVVQSAAPNDIVSVRFDSIPGLNLGPSGPRIFPIAISSLELIGHSNILVGDRVMVHTYPECYGVTRNGSTGTVISFEGTHAVVEFDYVTGDRFARLPQTFHILTAHLALLKESDLKVAEYKSIGKRLKYRVVA